MEAGENDSASIPSASWKTISNSVVMLIECSSIVAIHLEKCAQINELCKQPKLSRNDAIKLIGAQIPAQGHTRREEEQGERG